MELFSVIDHVNYATEDAFPYGADVRILDPSAGRGALDAQQDALEAAAVSAPRLLLGLHAVLIITMDGICISG